MQETESMLSLVVRCELKIPSLGITVPHQSASLMMPNSYPCDGIFNPHLTTIIDSYNLSLGTHFHKFYPVTAHISLCYKNTISHHSYASVVEYALNFVHISIPY